MTGLKEANGAAPPPSVSDPDTQSGVCIVSTEYPWSAPNDITWTARGSDLSELYSAGGIIDRTYFAVW